MLRILSIALAAFLLICSPAMALRSVHIGSDPIADQNWPAGSMELANLPTRLAYERGDSFASFVYRGDTALFQRALDAFAAIRAPLLRMTIHAGPYGAPYLAAARPQGGAPREQILPNPLQAGLGVARIDWSFTVYTPEDFFRNSERFRKLTDTLEAMPPPTLNVYIGSGGTINWSEVKVPSNLSVTDDRADAAGYKLGPVVRGELFDAITSKPIPLAQVSVQKINGPQNEVIAEEATGLDGRFELKGFAPQTLYIIANADGYAPRRIGYAEFNGNTLKQISAYLAPAATIGGTVVDQQGKALPGAKVGARQIQGPDGRGYEMPPGAVEATTDEQGHYTLGALPRGYASLSVTHPEQYQLDNKEPLHTPSRDVVIRMTRTGSIRVRLLGPAQPGRGQTMLFVRARGGSIKWGDSRQVIPGSSTQFDRVPPGDYLISADINMLDNEANAKGITATVKAGETVEVDVTSP